MRLLCVALTFFLVACAGEGFDQDGGDLKRGEIDVISTRLREAIEREYPPIKHKLVNHYVDTLGQAMVARNPDMPPLPYEFRVLRSNEVMVFSLPGGVVYLSLGLLRAVELEGQLAAAIAHELAHQQRGHPLVAWRRKVNSSRGQSYILDFSGDWKSVFLGERGAIYLDKGMEEEADTLAPLLLYRSGYDPRVYYSWIQQLQKWEVVAPADVAAIVSLHPPVADRLRWAKAGADRIPPLRDANISSATFQQIKSILKETAKRAGGKADKRQQKDAL